MTQQSLTEDWLELYYEAIQTTNLLQTFWWRAVVKFGLPLGVNAKDPRVIAATEDIRQRLSNG